jgi:glycosyltransferase involved in cell wall biosynthesis
MQAITNNPRVLSVVIPVYNEQATIRSVIEQVLQISYLLEIIVVNDGSQDGTHEVLEQLACEYSELQVIHHPKNKGKTAALKTGFQATQGDVVIVQDADLEYNPQEIPDVIEPILDNKADVVYGSRFLVRKAARVLYFSHYIANKFLTFLSDVFTNVNITDVETCYKAFRGDIIRNMIIKSQGFGFEIEVTAKVAKLKCRIFEVPISYYGRTYEEGKKIGLKDGIQAIWYIIYFNLFCSLKKSFHSLPNKSSHQNQNTLRLLN